MRDVSTGVAVKLNGDENVILRFKTDPDDADGDFFWGFQSRNEFGLFVSACQAFFTEVTRGD